MEYASVVDRNFSLLFHVQIAFVYSWFGFTISIHFAGNVEMIVSLEHKQLYNNNKNINAATATATTQMKINTHINSFQLLLTFMWNVRINCNHISYFWIIAFSGDQHHNSLKHEWKMTLIRRFQDESNIELYGYYEMKSGTASKNTHFQKQSTSSITILNSLQFGFFFIHRSVSSIWCFSFCPLHFLYATLLKLTNKTTLNWCLVRPTTERKSTRSPNF